MMRVFLIICFLLSDCGIGLAEDGNTRVAQMTGEQVDAPVLTSSLGASLGGNVSLDLRNIDVVDALKFLAMKASLNIVVTKNVTGKITLMVENVPVKDIFDIMLRSNELAYAKEGSIYNVMTEDEYKLLFGKKFSDQRQVRVYRIKYAIPDQVFTLIDTLKSDIGRVLVEPESGTAMIMDTPQRLKEIDDALATMEERSAVKVFVLKYAKAKEIEDQLKAHIDGKKVGMVRADERSNQIIVQALPDRMEDVEKLIAALDKKTKEVLIDTKIVKVKLSDQHDEGVEWEGLMNIMGANSRAGMVYMGSYPFSVLQSATSSWQSRQGFIEGDQGTTGLSGVGAYPFSGNTSSTSGSAKSTLGEAMHVGVVSRNRDMDFVFKYLETLGKTQILSNPKIAVINNQEARIHVGERQAYVTTTTTTGQTTTTVSEDVTFVDVGIQLAVTPTINDDGYVLLKIKPEVSSVVSTLTTPSGNTIPIIDTSMAETTVLVKNGSTIIIGGLRKEDKISSSSQLPILGKIPLLGFIFKSGTRKTERTELLVMLTPHIVTGDSLFTGDTRDLAKEPGKEYREYPSMTAETDYKPLEAPPEEKIKPYREYTAIKEQAQAKPTIKGDDANE